MGHIFVCQQTKRSTKANSEWWFYEYYCYNYSFIYVYYVTRYYIYVHYVTRYYIQTLLSAIHIYKIGLWFFNIGKGGIRPSYMAKDTRGTQLPTWKNGTTEATKLDIYGDVPTNKRLGFIW